MNLLSLLITLAIIALLITVKLSPSQQTSSAKQLDQLEVEMTAVPTQPHQVQAFEHKMDQMMQQQSNKLNKHLDAL